MPDLIELFGGHFMSPIEDPWTACARHRRESPVLYVDLPFRGGYLVFRYDDALAVLRDATTFASRINAEGIGLVMGRTIIEMDGKEHTRHRNIVSTFFVPKTIREKLPPVVEATAHRMIDAFASEGRTDLVERFTKTFPLRIVAGIIGIPIADYEVFQRWALAIIGFPADPAAGFEAAQAVSEFLRPIAEERRQAPTGDLLSALVHAEVDGERLTDEEVVSFLRLLLPAGAET
ncbi:MAG: cytochrome P450, partial [Candidatus Binatia bacterium]